MILICLIAAGLCAGPQSNPATASAPAAEIQIRDFLVIEAAGRAGRNPIHTDAIEARIVAGEKIEPREGDSVSLPDGSSKTWQVAKAGEDGALEHAALRGGYAYARVEMEADGVWLLEAAGHFLVYVNGELRTGDPYSLGFVQLPVLLTHGTNHLLFHGARGKLRAKLVRPKGPMVFLAGDVTTPTLVARHSGLTLLSVPLANCREHTWTPTLRAAVNGREPIPVTCPAVPALSVVKQTVQLDLSREVPSGGFEVRLETGWEYADTLTIQVPFDGAAAVAKRTFKSRIDGSVQYYAVKPAKPRPETILEMQLPVGIPYGDSPMILSLHGASVEATNQAAAYGETWADIVAPTNRRPYGFDWEDWGRLDALEVLECELQNRARHPRVYLSGHSMGGHGTWQLGVTFPDQFAAIGPSAGWISFWSYGGLRRFDAGNPVIDLLQRAASPSDTLALLSNLAPRGVYILHGDADDNVPVTQAREMREKLAPFHRDFQWHEQPGAGHWWDASDEPGTDCVDWAAMMDFFARRRLPFDHEVREVDFATASPGVSARCHWATIEQQLRPLAISRVKLRCDPQSRRFVGTTENVRRMSLELASVPYLEGVISVELDGQKIEADSSQTEAPLSGGSIFEVDRRLSKRPYGPKLHLERYADRWRVCARAPAAEKGPHRYGPFKAAFDNGFVFVIGTRGTPEENAWAFEKARYDAETWWYRGNGVARIMTDTQFAAAGHEGNVILYGNADTNGAWAALLGDSPVQVNRGMVKIGAREIRGDDLACLLVRPIAGSDAASVGVVAGTGMAGMRLANRVPYFVSGVAFPDCAVLRADTLSKGIEGVRAAGFFGHDWKIETGEFAFAE